MNTENKSHSSKYKTYFKWIALIPMFFVGYYFTRLVLTGVYMFNDFMRYGEIMPSSADVGSFFFKAVGLELIASAVGTYFSTSFFEERKKTAFVVLGSFLMLLFAFGLVAPFVLFVKAGGEIDQFIVKDALEGFSMLIGFGLMYLFLSPQNKLVVETKQKEDVRKGMSPKILFPPDIPPQEVAKMMQALAKNPEFSAQLKPQTLYAEAKKILKSLEDKL